MLLRDYPMLMCIVLWTSVEARCIKTVYQTHLFVRIATQFDCVEEIATLRANSRILSPDVDGALGEWHDAFVEHRLNNVINNLDGS